MSKAQRKSNAKLKRRQQQHDVTMAGRRKDTGGYTRPGSQNMSKSGGKR